MICGNCTATIPTIHSLLFLTASGDRCRICAGSERSIGYPKSQYAFSPSPKGGYLAFLGRIAPEKGVDRAIEIARRSRLPLRIAAKVDSADKDYFEAHILPLLDTPGVEFIGEIGEAEKSEFLGGAGA